MTDDQPIYTLEFMPNLQAELINKGIYFSNAYVTTPLCCPSRASILSGEYARHHNVLTNRAPDGGATKFNDSNSIAVWLQKAGYRTGLFGKYLNETDSLPTGYVPPGWNVWQAFFGRYQDDSTASYYNGYYLTENGVKVFYEKEAANFSTDLLTKKAINFINQSKKEPFFVMVNYFAPHDPYNFADRHKDMFRTDTEWQPYSPPNFLEKDINDKASWMQDYKPPSVDYIYHSQQRVLRSVQSIDDAVGSIVDTLSKRGIRDNTMIIYLSDNGQAIGENNFFGKNCPYDSCIHVPFIVSFPNIIRQPRVDNHFVLNIDIAPSLADLGSGTMSINPDGMNFIPLLSDPNANWRDGFMFEHFQEKINDDEGGSVALIPSFSGYRTNEWKYIEYENGETELFNLVVDPYEMENVASHIENINVMQIMSAKLHEVK